MGRAGDFLSSIRDRDNILLLMVALFTPRIVGFQYLEWWHSGSTHFTFLIISLTWQLTFSNGYFSVEGNVLGWLLSPSFLVVAIIFLPLLLFAPAFSWLEVVALLVPLIDLAFVGAVILHKRRRIGRRPLMLLGAVLLANSILMAIFMMTISVIYGTPPGVFISMLAPDLDNRFFTPLPLLLVVGWYQTRSVIQADSKT